MDCRTPTPSRQVAALYRESIDCKTPTPTLQVATGTSPAATVVLVVPSPAPVEASYFESPNAAAEQPYIGTDLERFKAASETSLHDYVAMRRMQFSEQEYEDGGRRLRDQGTLAASDLRALRVEVMGLWKKARAARWRRWFLGSIFASIIPAMRRILRNRVSIHNRLSSNKKTEDAFQRSKDLIVRILETSVHGQGEKSASASAVAFFVLGVLYVFQSEVSVRAAGTVSKRLKNLATKVEDGVDDVDERDLKSLSGWRWSVLPW